MNTPVHRSPLLASMLSEAERLRRIQRWQDRFDRATRFVIRLCLLAIVGFLLGGSIALARHLIRGGALPW